LAIGLKVATSLASQPLILAALFHSISFFGGSMFVAVATDGAGAMQFKKFSLRSGE
jgi:hypothetical protein